jgi:hypothetical protein
LGDNSGKVIGDHPVKALKVQFLNASKKNKGYPKKPAMLPLYHHILLLSFISGPFFAGPAHVKFPGPGAISSFRILKNGISHRPGRHVRRRRKIS